MDSKELQEAELLYDAIQEARHAILSKIVITRVKTATLNEIADDLFSAIRDAEKRVEEYSRTL